MVANEKWFGGAGAVAGFYDWHFIDEDILVKARFTYLTDSEKPSPILHHHSSLLP